MQLEELRQSIQTDLLADFQTRVENDQDLLFSGLLDSLNVMRLVAFIEKGLGINIPPEDVAIEHLGSIGNIMQHLNTREIVIGN